MGELVPSSRRIIEKDYSLRSLWRAVMGFPAAAALGVSALTAPGVRIPDDWELGLLDYQGADGLKQAEVYVIPAREPRGVVGFLPGWKTQAVDKMDAILDLQEAGYSVLSMSLVNPGLETGSLDDSLSRIKSFAFSNDSPLFNMYSGNLPRFVVTHSTSGMLFQHALLDARSDGGSLPPIAHAFHTAPFFDTSGSSALFHPRTNKIYTGHAKRHMNELAGTPLMDRLYYYFRGISRLLMEEDPAGRPTHGQILEISAYGKRYFERRAEEERNGGPQVTLPQTFIISTDDSFSCPHTAEKAGQLERAELRFCKAQHNPLLDIPVRRSLIERLQDLTVPNDLVCYLDEISRDTYGPYIPDMTENPAPSSDEESEGLVHQLT